MTTPPRPAFYEKPPIIERVASVYAEMDEAEYESRLDEWQMMVMEEFPIFEPIKEWLLMVEEREGIPLLNTARPELRITPRFSRKHSRDGFDWSIRCPVGQFTMNMHSTPGEGRRRRYSHLRGEFGRWLAEWMRHFDVRSPRQLTLQYVNALDRRTVPQFYNGPSHLAVDQIINIFTQIPGKHECLLPPYECKVAVKLPGEPDSKMLIQLDGGGQDDGSPAVYLRLVVFTELPRAESSEGLLRLLDHQHQHILDRFEAIFTEDARKSFEPRDA